MEARGFNTTEQDRQELETVAAALERTPRLAHLLRYLGESCFFGHADQLSEYNIATEVFGRNKSTFIASEDAIARVETHRLRKKLKAYYEAEGKDHPVQITLPTGSYAPVFFHSPESSASVPAPETSLKVADHTSELTLPDASTGRGGRLRRFASVLSPRRLSGRRRAGFYAAAAILLALVGFGVFSVVRGNRQSKSFVNSIVLSGASNSGPGVARSDGGAVQSPFRMILGYTGPAQRDSAGDIWQPDRFFRGGWAVPEPSVYIAGTSDPFLFRYGRLGEFYYNIPLAPGTYELHLYAVSLAPALQSEDDQNKAVFDVLVNDQLALANFDPISDAMGINVADERVLRDVSPEKDGFLHLHVSTQIGTPALSALEIVPGLPHSQLPIRIVMQNAPWTDHNGQLWHPDTYFIGGRRLSHTLPNAWAIDTGLYSTERYGHFSYAIPVDSRDRYTVVLHFAELFFGVSSSAASGPGNRVFRVLCNGNTLLDDFDIVREVGSGHPLTKTFYHLNPTAQGKLNLVFEPIVNYATVSAIEVLDESK